MTTPTQGRLARLGFSLLWAFIASTSLLQTHANAQDFSGKPITMVVGFAPGGSNDIAARIIAPYMGELLGTTVVVENKTGAAGMISGSYVVKSAPDGHTLLLSSLSPIVVSPQTKIKPPFHTPTDLIAVNMVGLSPQAIAINNSLPNVKTLADLFALSKTRQITLSSSGTGSLSHLTIEMLTTASNGKLVHVPYKGGGPAVTDTIAGHVDGVVMDLSPILPMSQDGRLNVLAVTTENRIDFLPNTPTAKEDLPNFTAVNWVGVFAPAQTPANVINKINDAIVKVVARPDVQDKLKKAAIVPQTMESPAKFQAFINNEYKHYGEVMKQAKVELSD
jgi:tripartite-type tricarboxylate transporter receptor subunit TctC